MDGKRNGVGVISKEEPVSNVLEECLTLWKKSVRVMSLKLETEGVMFSVVSVYAPQAGCELEQKDKLWTDRDEVMERINRDERVVISADFSGDEEVYMQDRKRTEG